MCIPVSMMFEERNFSKSKLMKSYLRSNMSEDRVTGLSVMSVERQMNIRTRCRHGRLAR